MLQIPGATSYMGSIGKDKYGEEMKKNAKDAGVNVGSSSLIFSLSGFFLVGGGGVIINIFRFIHSSFCLCLAIVWSGNMVKRGFNFIWFLHMGAF